MEDLVKVINECVVKLVNNDGYKCECTWAMKDDLDDVTEFTLITMPSFDDRKMVCLTYKVICDEEERSFVLQAVPAVIGAVLYAA